jgi:hypothetical protein
MLVMNTLNVKQTALERAFDIARLGHCESFEEIQRRLPS